MLEVESLTVAVGTFRLREVGLRVAPGECHAVLGPSGSGKSTLLHAILGLLTCQSGRIRLEGADLAAVPIQRRGLGYVPQQLALFPHLTVRDNLAYSARARRTPPATFQPALEELIAATGIGALLDRRPDTLSGGERQRVGLVRALASRPRLVLLDEPFTALNETLRRELWWLMRELQRRWRLTVLFVTHDLAEAYFLADRVTVLLDGRVAQQGEKTDVYGRPAAADVARFLGVETLQPGRIIAASEGIAVVQVGSARLSALAAAGLSNDVLVSIRGEDVMLEGDMKLFQNPGETGQRPVPQEFGDSVMGPKVIGSARNRLPARVVAVRPGNPLVCVELDAGFPLVALVTRSACEELALRPGSAVTAVMKAPAVHLLNRPR